MLNEKVFRTTPINVFQLRPISVCISCNATWACMCVWSWHVWPIIYVSISIERQEYWKLASSDDVTIKSWCPEKGVAELAISENDIWMEMCHNV